MRKTQLIILALIGITFPHYGQDTIGYSSHDVNRSSAYKIEKVKKLDCTIISYNISEWNKTLTRRDDRQVGTFYYASGKDCQKCFEETFATMKFTGEEFLPVPTKTIDADSFENISIVTVSTIIASGYTKLFLTSLWGDKFTTDPSDDIYVGTDIIVDSADPDKASPLDISKVYVESKVAKELLETFVARSYFKSRGMIINRNLIIEKLREEKKLKDITPVEKTKSIAISYKK